MKLFLSMLCALSFVSGAVALPTPDNARENCRELEIAGTHVWSEKRTDCIPVNPCMSNSHVEYCNGAFMDFRFESLEVAEKLVAKYLKNFKKQDVQETITSVWKADRVLGVKTTDGDYLGFMFEWGYTGTTVKPKTIFDATCLVFGKGQKDPSTDVNGNKLVYCADVKSQQVCDEMAKFAQSVAGREVIGRLQKDENSCELMYAE